MKKQKSTKKNYQVKKYGKKNTLKLGWFQKTLTVNLFIMLKNQRKVKKLKIS